MTYVYKYGTAGNLYCGLYLIRFWALERQCVFSDFISILFYPQYFTHIKLRGSFFSLKPRVINAITKIDLKTADQFNPKKSPVIF